MQHHHRGFTLVELAIVLVIIGLIAGGIMAGSGMVRSAEVQSIASDLQDIESAVKNFHDHYFALPGDFSSATAQWGAGTDNGNDDSTINDPVIDEYTRAWQHLALADMMKGSYTGVPSPAGFLLAGHNVPEAKIGGGGYVFNMLGNQMLGGQPAGTSVTVAKFSDTALTRIPLLTPAEAFSIDLKFDDGKPGTGLITAPDTSGSYPDCVTTNVVNTSEYKGTVETIECIITFRLSLDR